MGFEQSAAHQLTALVETHWHGLVWMALVRAAVEESGWVLMKAKSNRLIARLPEP